MDHHLIADDNELNRLVVKILLEKNGFKIDEAENGNQVIEKTKSDLDKYSIIWLDIEMPEMDGIQCAKKLRNDLKYDGTIIGITGHVDSDSVSACKNAGMDSIIAKPMSEENLMDNVRFFSKK